MGLKEIVMFLFIFVISVLGFLNIDFVFYVLYYLFFGEIIMLIWFFVFFGGKGVN